jgi:hypothetical protein
MDDEPRCSKCGVPITTGIMAAFCPAGRECELWVAEMAEFMRDMGMTPPPATQEPDHG